MVLMICCKLSDGQEITFAAVRSQATEDFLQRLSSEIHAASLKLYKLYNNFKREVLCEELCSIYEESLEKQHSALGSLTALYQNVLMMDLNIVSIFIQTEDGSTRDVLVAPLDILFVKSPEESYLRC